MSEDAAKYRVMAVERDEIHMQGKTKSQCMRPTVQNVSVVRVHIRVELGLDP